MEAIPVPTFERHNVCLSCGYDLFGQPRNGVCPECGNSTRESALQETFLSLPGNVDRLKSGSTYLLISSILSGFCPGVCLFAMAVDGNIFVAFLMTIVFAATCWTATVGDRRLRAMFDSNGDPDERRRTRQVMVVDSVAGIGLVLINAGAYVWAIFDSYDRHGSDDVVGALVGVGFFFLSIVAFRAAWSGAMQARVAKACLGGKRGLQGFGVIKAVYETIWLTSCWLTLAGIAFDNSAAIAVATISLFGLVGFACLWLLMIGLHAALLTTVRRQFRNGPRGFDVVAAKSLEGVTP